MSRGALVGELEIPRATPSLNRLLTMHWARRRKLKAELLQWVLLEQMNRRLRRATGPRHCLVVRYYCQAWLQLDSDNLAGGAKPLVDALVYRKLLIDDSPRYVTLEYEQQPRKTAGMRVVLYEAA